jgi:hypothetical protein
MSPAVAIRHGHLRALIVRALGATAMSPAQPARLAAALAAVHETFDRAACSLFVESSSKSAWGKTSEERLLPGNSPWRQQRPAFLALEVHSVTEHFLPPWSDSSATEGVNNEYWMPFSCCR